MRLGIKLPVNYRELRRRYDERESAQQTGCTESRDSRRSAISGTPGAGSVSQNVGASART